MTHRTKHEARWTIPLCALAAFVPIGCATDLGDEATGADEAEVTTATALPGRLQLESYNGGGEGVGYHDSTPGNQGGVLHTDDVDLQPTSDVGGGYNVGWVTAGEWLRYAVTIASAGSYDLTLRMAASTADAKSARVFVDGNAVGARFTLSGGDGYQSWHSVTVKGIALPAGSHTLKLTFDSDNVNVNYLDVVKSVSTPTCTISSKLVPSCGVWWGMYSKPNGSETQGDAIARTEAYAGRKFGIVHAYHEGNADIPNATEKTWSDEGRVLLLNWKPAPSSWAVAASGSIDASVIVPVAQRLKAFGKPLFLGLYHEPENDIPGVGQPADYVAMWHHVRQIFDQQGVTNVVWVWNMMGYEGYANHYTSGDLYPGDAYVDWIAADPYQRQLIASKFIPFSEIVNRTTPTFPGFYSLETSAHPSKPIMLAEYGSMEATDDPNARANWFRSIPSQLASRPNVKAVVYFAGVGPKGDWQIDTAAGQKGFADAGHDPIFAVHP